ncbi:MAG: right-handed parallel beta-helix repeat-containing protein [Luteolibacter sp.]
MNLSEARKILGLEPDEDPSVHLEDLEQARARIEKLVRTAPNPTLADRYRAGLTEFDDALALVRKDCQPAKREPALTQKLDPDTPPPVPAHARKPVPPILAENSPAPEPTSPVAQKRGSSGKTLCVLLLLAALGAGGRWFYQDYETRRIQREERVTALEKQVNDAVSQRDWLTALKACDELKKLAPALPLLAENLRTIETAMREEQHEFVTRWNTQAKDDLAAGRWSEAETAVRQVLARYPSDPEAPRLLEQITSARTAHQRQLALDAIKLAMDNRDWDGATEALKKLSATAPNDPAIADFQKQITAGREKTAADQARALELLKKAQAIDNGASNPTALAYLREAILLFPGQPEILATLQKIASYGRTITVPGDYATLAKAVAESHDNDRIVLGEGIWQGPVTLKASVEIQGAGLAKTIIECAPTEGCALSVSSPKSRISGITFRHRTFTDGTERYSAALVSGGSAIFENCRFSDASGHGLAVIEGGTAQATRCRFSENGWNGAAALGKGSTLTVEESESAHNYQHGIEAWDGATLNVRTTRCHDNILNGIHFDSTEGPVTLEGNQLTSNGEFGIVLDHATGGTIQDNYLRQNALGGMVVRFTAGAVAVLKNEITQNQGAGLILEKGLTSAVYQNNRLDGNKEESLLSGIDLTEKP